MGPPVADFVPSTTQLLLPSSEWNCSSGGRALARSAFSVHRRSFASLVTSRIAGEMASRSRPGGTSSFFSGSVGLRSCAFETPNALISSARITSLDALRDSVHPGIRVRTVCAVQAGCGWNPRIWNSTGTFRSSIAFSIAALIPAANASKILRPSGWYFLNSSSQFPRNVNSRANLSRVMYSGPSTSARRPSPLRRHISSCHIRSWATT
jgi:hypothetical protein